MGPLITDITGARLAEAEERAAREEENCDIRYTPPEDHILAAAEVIRSRPLWHLRPLVSLDRRRPLRCTPRGRSKSRRRMRARSPRHACRNPRIRATLAPGMRVMVAAESGQ